MITFEIIEGVPSDNLINELALLEETIFLEKPLNFDKLKYEFEGKNNLLIVLAKSSNKYVGFKVGFERRKKQFYSWMGGVIPQYRKQGIALELMNRQHSWLSEKKYKRVRTQTGNEFRNMITLNIKNGFDIMGTFLNRKNKIRIILEKNLLETN